MALFWFLAGVLCTLAVIVLILPWLRTIPRLGSLPSLPWQAGVIACLVVVAVLGLYRWVGHPELANQGSSLSAMDSAATATIVAANSSPGLASSSGAAAPGAGATGAAAKSGAGSMGSAIASLEARLAKGGATASDWELLAKSYEFLGRPADAGKARAHQLPPLPADANEAPAAQASAATAPTLSADSQQLLLKANGARQKKQMKEAAAIYSQLAARGQMNADSWADYADTAASLQGEKLAGAPESYIAKALAIDPQQPKALWLKASADEEAGRVSAAAIVWQRLQAVLPAESADAKIVNANLQRDLKLAGTGGPANPAAPPPAAASSSGTQAGVAVSGEVSLAAALSAKAAAGAILFIVAKSVDSPGVPVAVYRSSVGTWPLKFTLDDSQSMLPGRNLSSAGRVTIEARISQTGQPLPAAGDLQGSSGTINPSDHRSLKILIDRVIT